MFSNTNSTCIHNDIFRVCITIFSSNLCHSKGDRYLFKMIPNMNEFVYRLLRKTTVLRIFQTPPYTIYVSEKLGLGGNLLLYERHGSIPIYLF